MPQQKLKIQRLRNKIRVLNDCGFYTDVLTEEQTEEITKWVNELQIGRRVSWDMWQLYNKESVTMFILKWGETQ